MKIELRKLKIAEHMSEETTAFSAEIYVDGKATGYAKNDGRGGCTGYHSNGDEKSRELMKSAEAYCLTLPAQRIDMGSGRKPLVIEMNLENFIDELVEASQSEKEQKKLEKKMINTIMWGQPKGRSYAQVKLPQPITSYPLPAIQKTIDSYKKEFKEGDVFLNTNLEVLGVKL